MRCTAGTCFYSVKCSIYNGIHKQILLRVNYETFSYRILGKRKFQEKRQTKKKERKREKICVKKTHANENM